MWSKPPIPSGSFTVLWRTNKMFPVVWVTYRASLWFHFNVFISCSPKFFCGAAIVCSFFSQLPFLILVLGLMQQQVSWNIQAKTQLPGYFWNGMMCGKSTSLQPQLFCKTFFSKWGWAQETGWTLEQSKFCLLVMFDVTVLLNIPFSKHFDVLIQLERALGLGTHSHALEKTSPKIQLWQCFTQRKEFLK